MSTSQPPVPSRPAPEPEPSHPSYGMPVPSAPAGYPQPPVYAPEPSTASRDSGGFGWAVLGFFLPVVGLVLWLVWRDARPLDARKAGVGALTGVIVTVVLYLLFFLFLLLSVNTGNA